MSTGFLLMQCRCTPRLLQVRMSDFLIIRQFLAKRQLCLCSATNMILTSIVPSNREYIDTEMRLCQLNGERRVKVKFSMAAKRSTFDLRTTI